MGQQLWILHGHFPTLRIRPFIKVVGKILKFDWTSCNRTYCSEFKKMLQVLLFICLESVERYFGGQLAAWKRKPEEFIIICGFYVRWCMNWNVFIFKISNRVLHSRKNTLDTHVCDTRAEMKYCLNCPYWTGSSPTAIDQRVWRLNTRPRGKTFCRSTKFGFAVNTLQSNEPFTTNNKRVAKYKRTHASSLCVFGSVVFFPCARPIMNGFELKSKSLSDVTK